MAADTEDRTERDAQAERMLAELDDITSRLRLVPYLYERRTELYEQLRSLDPPVPYEVISQHTDSKSEAVRVAVNKARREADGNPITRRKSG